MIISIPFSGFYESHHMAHMEEAMELYEVDEDDVDWREYMEAVAEEYSMYLSDYTGFGWVFKELRSPREYNFRTDEILVEIPETEVARIALSALQRGGFREYVKDACASRDGFISYLPDDLALWPIVWEAGHVETALNFLAKEEDWEEEVREDMVCNGGYHCGL